jgi:hypothetical protein
MDTSHVGKDRVRFEVWVITGKLGFGSVKFEKGKTSDVLNLPKGINTASAGKT